MEYKNKIIPTKVLLSLDGSESFIIRTLKDRIMSDPIQFGCATYGDLEGKKYKIYYDNNVNKNDILKSVEFCYYKEDDSPDVFELCNLNTDRIEITEPVDVSYHISIIGNKKVAQLSKTVDFFIRIDKKYKVRITGVIRIGKYEELNKNAINSFNKITSTILADRYAFTGCGFKIDSDTINMKIDYTPDHTIKECCDLLIELMSSALENCYAPLRELEAKK